MRKVLYITKGEMVGWNKRAFTCHGRCNECTIRFRCFTTKYETLEVTREEALLCREKNGKDGGIIL